MSIAPVPAPDAELLAALARRLVTADGPLGAGPPLLLAIPHPPADADELERTDGTDAEVLSLDGASDPLTLLCHTRARAAWAVAGVLVDGWTLPIGLEAGIDWRTLSSTTRISEHPSRQRVRTLFLVSRSGAVALAMHPGRDQPTEVHAVDDGAEPGGPCGPIPDGLRRLFGLPTPPPTVTALELWASIWLGAAVAARRVRSWPDLADLHPAAAILDEAHLRATPEHLVVAGRALASARGWDELQLAAVTGPSWPIMPASDIAAWADLGMFSRLVVREVPPLWHALEVLDHRLPAELSALVHDVLDAWALDAQPPGSARRVAAPG